MEMQETRVELLDVSQTGNAMGRMIRTYWRDMADLATAPPEDVFLLIQSVPYRRDPKDEEYLQRPLAFRLDVARGADCDDRAIAVGCWAVAAGYPWRVVAVSRNENKRLHHVFCEVYFSGAWLPMDPTYSSSGLGRAESWTKRQILSPSDEGKKCLNI